MDLRICFVFACVLGLTISAPVAQETARNFIPNRYELRGELLNDDGSFSRQDPTAEEEPSVFDEANNGQYNRLSYQQSNGYPSQYGQSYNYYQQPQQYGGQNQQTSFYNSPQNDQVTNDMPLPLKETDDIAKDDSNEQEQAAQAYYSQLQQQQQQQAQSEPEQQSEPGQYQSEPGQYQNYAFNDQQQPQQPQQQYYYGQQQTPYQQQYNYQPQSEAGDDMQGAARDQTNDELEVKKDDSDDLSSDEDDESAKRDAIVRQNIKKFKIPSTLSEKDREGMLGFTKQVYLRGGH